MPLWTPDQDAQKQSWCALWGVPDLECRVEFSPRLKASLGRCLVRKSLIRLHPALQAQWAHLLSEVLCHELAHLAVERLHPGARPHGPEWTRLVEQAGYPARRRILLDEGPPRSPKPKPRYLHRCPICQLARVARRRMRWLCPQCDQLMVIE